MKKFIAILALIMLSEKVWALDVAEEWQRLQNLYAEQIEKETYLSAIETAEKLNGIDPSDTYSLLYIVFAYTKAQKPIPNWVLANPWPNVTNKDKLNRKIAEALAFGT